MTDDTFHPLLLELSRWKDHGKICRFWWRDDDLVRSSPALTRMHKLAEQYACDALVAVIPKLMDENIGNDVRGMDFFTWCQHGFSHQNFEEKGLPKSEFPKGRDKAAIVEDLILGKELMERQFEQRFFPILVPPWNSIGEDVIEMLAPIGYIGVSQYGRRPQMKTGTVTRANTHFDVVDWSIAPRFPAERSAFLVKNLAKILERKRVDEVDPDEPIGILSHHRAMDDGAWKFMDDFMKTTREISCVEWISPKSIYQRDVC